MNTICEVVQNRRAGYRSRLVSAPRGKLTVTAKYYVGKTLAFLNKPNSELLQRSALGLNQLFAENRPLLLHSDRWQVSPIAWRRQIVSIASVPRSN
jgi:hypothetical protein